MYYRGNNESIDIEIDRDGFAADKPVSINPVKKSFSLVLENRTGDAHTLSLNIKGFPAGTYMMKTGKKVAEKIILTVNTETIKVAMTDVPLTTLTFEMRN